MSAVRASETIDAPLPGETLGCAADEVLRVEDVSKHFHVRAGLLGRASGQVVRAVDGVSLVLHRGRTLGLVGESGSGKSTLAGVVLRVLVPTSGRVTVAGHDLGEADRRTLRAARRRMQIVFQDPFGSLNPRLTAGQIIEEPLRVHRLGSREERRQRVLTLLEQVGLSAEVSNRYPHQFSGGERQRIAIARALATRPELLVCDEPTSALDVSIKSQILNLLADLQAELGLAYVLVTHDLSVVSDVADSVAVMYLGKVVEFAPTNFLYRWPQHPYTIALLSSVPIPDPQVEAEREAIVLRGDPPSPINQPSGCRFHPRCWRAEDVCRTEEPPLVQLRPGHWAACHFPGAEGTPAQGG